MPKLVDQTTYSGGRNRRAIAAQIGAWHAFVRAFNAATRLSAGALEGTSLDPSEYDILVTLVQGPPEGLRPGEVAERVLLTKSGITRLMDRVEKRGLIERRACLTDRRGQLIVLTAEGRRLLRRATPRILRSLRAILGTLSAAELETLTRLSERMEAAATAHSTM